MALPNGYRRLKCLKSTGTQYFNTGVVPSNDLRFELDCEVTYGTGWIMIAGPYDSGSRFSWWAKASQLYGYYGTANKNMAGASSRMTLVADNNVWTDGTNTMTFTEETLAATNPIYICSVHNGGSYALASMAVYGGKVIKNGTLTNNYIPALRESDSKPGLYDDVGGGFLTNAGTGEFGYEEVEPAGNHRTMVDGVIWGTPSGRCLVDGVGYSIQKGRTMVDGVGYDVKFGGLSIGDLEVGASVYATFNGGRTEFLVVQQGLPSSLYDVSCDGTWLLPKYVYAALQPWDTAGTNNYQASTIHKFANETYFSLFDSGMQSIIKTVKIPYVNGNGNAAIATGASGLETKMFLLSGYEVGFTIGTNWHFPVDGARLSYFLEGSAADANAKRAGYRGPGNSIGWALRSASMQTTNSVMGVANGGAWTSLSATNSIGARPAFILDSGTDIDPETFDILV